MAESEEFKKASEGAVARARGRRVKPPVSPAALFSYRPCHVHTEQAKQGDPMTAFKQMMGMEAKPVTGNRHRHALLRNCLPFSPPLLT